MSITHVLRQDETGHKQCNDLVEQFVALEPQQRLFLINRLCLLVLLDELKGKAPNTAPWLHLFQMFDEVPTCLAFVAGPLARPFTQHISRLSLSEGEP